MENQAIAEFRGGAPTASARLRIEGPPETLPSLLPVTDLAVAAVAAAGLAAADLLAARGGGVGECVVDRRAVAVAFTSERHLRLDGAEVGGWARLSGFFRTRDGWVRTHANYPHHEERLLAALGLPSGSDRAAVAAHLARRNAADVEDTVTAAGGLAVAVRSPDAWAASLAGRAASTGPVVDVEPTPVGAPAAAGPGSTPVADGGAPAAGVRVLDLTRVIAGPVATRTLAYLGADVLRVDPPGLPELIPQHLDMGLGKRSTLLDLRSPADRHTFDELLAGADVVVTGYRSDAVDALGLDPARLRAARPELVVAGLTAWGASGPWRTRRGFDSLVQAATGVAALTADAEGAPGVLPAQALDHATGYLLAAAILRALARPATGATIRASLARTAAWLLNAPRPQRTGGEAERSDAWLAELPSPYGVVRHAVAPFRLDGRPGDWTTGPVTWGSSEPVWL
ncbi:CoA transferase [Cryptosporangium arvum]|uniref:CoA transferase n=1 Tax=Cryptosporangium arvum TaxID=80871 RepID=UPI0004AF2185|nr:CoA transferase [Cryptosporangium arvum]